MSRQVVYLINWTWIPLAMVLFVFYFMGFGTQLMFDGPLTKNGVGANILWGLGKTELLGLADFLIRMITSILIGFIVVRPMASQTTINLDKLNLSPTKLKSWVTISTVSAAVIICFEQYDFLLNIFRKLVF